MPKFSTIPNARTTAFLGRKTYVQQYGVSLYRYILLSTDDQFQCILRCKVSIDLKERATTWF